MNSSEFQVWILDNYKFVLPYGCRVNKIFYHGFKYDIDIRVGENGKLSLFLWRDTALSFLDSVHNEEILIAAFEECEGNGFTRLKNHIIQTHRGSNLDKLKQEWDAEDTKAR